ncbi:hypothetical protein RN001_011185 [Aquatica leii]|uniref:Peptidase S1 domain-containing protein n=1 Tax=Aquatica leii TaxID=1421715 RepID=A0AAN7P7Q2_9COLE|nr:hypothetical protein RN001_011185 [Aquatica leii]
MMKILFVVLLIKSILSAEVNDRIIGGTLAADRQFPYQVSIRNQSLGHVCGGAIIKSYWVITAARCVFRASPSSTYIVVGTISLLPSGTTFPVSKFVIHPQYDDGTLKNNIALIQTSDRMLGAPKTALVPLNIDVTLPGEMGVLSGWGKLTTSAPSFPTSLYYANVSVISLSQCRAALPQYTIDDNSLCTYTSGYGSCDGDNGNPFVRNNMLTGIMSWGIPCAVGKPDVLVNVTSYACWIITNAN